MILSWIRRKLRNRRERKIRDRYMTFAIALGDALSYLHVGDSYFRWEDELWSVREHSTYHQLNELEAAYSSLGYRIVPLDAWIDHAGWGVSIDKYWRVPREEGERPWFTQMDITDLPTPSPMLEILERTGKPVVAEVDEDGETVYRVVDDA